MFILIFEFALRRYSRMKDFDCTEKVPLNDFPFSFTFFLLSLSLHKISPYFEQKVLLIAEEI